MVGIGRLMCETVQDGSCIKYYIDLDTTTIKYYIAPALRDAGFEIFSFSILFFFAFLVGVYVASNT